MRGRNEEWNDKQRKGEKWRKGFFCLLTWFWLCMLCSGCGDSDTASVMQLVKTQGNLTVQNEEGERLSYFEMMQLYSGYDLATARASYAWINLDSVKLAKMDADSEIEIQKSGSQLEILVNEGKVFFNITEPLKKEESLNIRTSTMSVGIRGTCGWVEAYDSSHMRVYILEGTVECSVLDEDGGVTASEAVSGGQMADMLFTEEEGASFTLEAFTAEDILPFVQEELDQDEELRKRIQEDSGLVITVAGYSSDGGPGTPFDQAGAEFRRLQRELAENEISGEQDLLDGTMNSAEGDIQMAAGSEYAGLVSSLQDALAEQMIEGAESEELPWWQKSFAQTLAPYGGSGNGVEELTDYMQLRMGSDINCYKPNIYLYGKEGAEFEFRFAEPVLLTRTLPEYKDSWHVALEGDGMLTVDGEEGLPYLFYESRTIPGIFQTKEGFWLGTSDRAAQWREILGAYGLNTREIEDFIEFWDEMLETDQEYIMYPQTTELVDEAMPVEIDGARIDHYFRIWFCFGRAEGLREEVISPRVEPASHEGTALVEWGGMVLP